MTVPAVPRLLYITLWEIKCNIGRKKASCNAAKFRNLYIVKQNKMNIQTRARKEYHITNKPRHITWQLHWKKILHILSLQVFLNERKTSNKLNLEAFH